MSEHQAIYDPVGSSPEIAAAKFDLYKKEHARSIADPNRYWDVKAKSLLDWFSPYTSVSGGDLNNGDMSKFCSYVLSTFVSS